MKFNVVYDDPSKTKGMNKEDMSNNAQHVYFLQKKKAEILARKEREKATTTAAETVVKPPPPKLKFANDGSFLERFKMMQQQQQQQQQQDGSSRDVPKQPKAEVADAIPGAAGTESSDYEKSSPKIFANISSQNTARQELRTPASIFLTQDDEVDACQPTEYELAKQLAEKVAKEGVEAEEDVKKKYGEDSRYKFLHNPSSPVCLYYQSQLRECQKSASNLRKRRWDDQDGTSSQHASQQQASSPPPGNEGSSSSTLPSSSSGVSSSGASVDPMVEFAKAKALLAAKVAAINNGSVHIPTVTSEEEKKRQKAIDEQRMMNELYRKVIEQQAFFAKQRTEQQKNKYDYDSDEDVDGGTWEHKKRKLEMKKTEEWAGSLTEKGRGKHHLSDFLPPEELEKFMENVKAVQEGRQADISDYAKFKIQADNVGFQLLQKAGWEEGSGLGKKSDGIIQPVNKGKTSFDQSGVGAEKPMDVSKDDDDFELYRKRMMLAYKFRPNPMNNPRRPYY